MLIINEVLFFAFFSNEGIGDCPQEEGAKLG
jgi:hypothetical protein